MVALQVSSICFGRRYNRQIRFAVYAVIAYSTSVVDVALILGPNLPGTLATRLAQWMQDADLTARFTASAGALLQLCVTLAALMVWYGLEQLGRAILAGLRDRGLRFVHDKPLRTAAAFCVVVIGLAVFSGLALLSLWSVAGLWQFPDLLPKTLRGAVGTARCRGWSIRW